MLTTVPSIQFLTCILEDISAFINHITDQKPTFFKTCQALGFSVMKPGDDRPKRYILPDCSEHVLRLLLEQAKEEEEDMEMMWRAFQDDVYIPFEEFLDEALLPPATHSGMLYTPKPSRYSLEGYVCAIFPISCMSHTSIFKLLIPQVLWDPTFKARMQGVTDTMRQVSNW